MEDSNPQVQQPVSQPQPVSIPTYQQTQIKKKGGNKWLLVFVGLLILGGAGIFFFSQKGGADVVSPTPYFDNSIYGDATEASSPTPTSTPVEIDRTDISVQILNGTGISGEAALLETKIKALGYTKVEVGNASSQNATDTTVTFGKDVVEAVKDEIEKVLEGMYKKVVVKTSTTQSSDVVIVTGLRTNQTAKPSVTATSTPATTASPTSTSTASPSPTATN